MSAHLRPPPPVGHAIPHRSLSRIDRDIDCDIDIDIECDIAWISRDGGLQRDVRTVRETETVAAATSILPHGALLRTETGPIAIEDLRPGIRVALHDGAFARVVWICARTHAPRGGHPVAYRVAGRAFGPHGPETDIVLGATAHVLIASPRCIALVGGRTAFAAVAAFEDGHAVTAIAPAGEVATWGFACARPEAVWVGGLAIESAHTARIASEGSARRARDDLAQLMPHLLARAPGLPRLPRLPRLTMAQARALAAEGLSRG